MAANGIPKWLAAFAAAQTKLHLEGQYDKLDQTETIKGLKALPADKRYGIATALNLLATVFERNFPENSAFQLFLKKIAEDAGPELGKRIVNGKPEEKIVFRTFLAMSQEDLVSLLEWLEKTPVAERDANIRQLSALPPEEINKLVSLSPEQFALFRSLFWKETKKPGKPPDPVRMVKDTVRGIFLKPKKASRHSARRR